MARPLSSRQTHPVQETVADRPGIRVLIVDEDWRVRQSLAGLISLGERIESVETAGDTGSALRVLEERHPDVILIDPRLPDDRAGLLLLDRIRSAWPALPIIAMSASDTVEDPALECGCAAFVAKGGQPSEFLDAIAGALRPPRDRSALDSAKGADA